MSSFLHLYEPLDIIGNGSFGIIRKVRRKSDGLIFARKELNFERMSERDRKQIVAEVNILKDLHHEHIVRYHDRYVDRDAGILYILMEYCGGGDLSTVIKQAQKHNRPIPEDTIWNYFMQTLLALHHCHHPNGHARSGSGGSDSDGREKRVQILHRDLKPDNVFLDESNTVKLGDFGLSKQLAQASFANTYVGTPYYMSPELMQEKAYDSKSDIWSLGCLIYELCALKPPFHEAKTHAELSIFIRNGRIPPLPRGYSQSLSAVIKAMLNLNPAMRPSAAQLLQHERLELVFKVSETEKMLATVKAHKATIIAKERELISREAAFVEKEAQMHAIISHKDAEIISLQHLLNTQSQSQSQSESVLDARIREAIAKREEELRVAVMKREEEVAAAMARREEEIMSAVRKREEEIGEAWRVRENQIRIEIGEAAEERMKWIVAQQDEIEAERQRLDGVRKELEAKVKMLDECGAAENKGRKDKTPLEEVKNLLAPLVRMTETHHRTRSVPEAKQKLIAAGLETPVNRNSAKFPGDYEASAMKGVIFTATGEALATPAPAELVNLFVNSPKVGLNFARIFDFGEDGEACDEGDLDSDVEGPPPSPSIRDRAKVEPSSSITQPQQSLSAVAPPSRLRRPSIRRSTQRPGLPASTSDPSGRSSPVKSVSSSKTKRPSTSTGATTKRPTSVPQSSPPPAEYDFSDEENLPSPFLKRVERERAMSTGGLKSAGLSRRPSSGNLLRAVAAANAASAAGTSSGGAGKGSVKGNLTRPSVASARKASEEARKALLRQ